jgi:hypothetical protein
VGHELLKNNASKNSAQLRIIPCKIFKCPIPHAPFSQSLTSLYFLSALQSCTSHVGSDAGVDLGLCSFMGFVEAERSTATPPPSPSEGEDKTPTGIEKDKPAAFETHRNIAGPVFSSSSSSISPSPSPSSPSPSSASEMPCAGVAAAVCVRETEAVMAPPKRLFFVWRLDCFLRRRFIVSACTDELAKYHRAGI